MANYELANGAVLDEDEARTIKKDLERVHQENPALFQILFRLARMKGPGYGLGGELGQEAGPLILGPDNTLREEARKVILAATNKHDPQGFHDPFANLLEVLQ